MHYDIEIDNYTGAFGHTYLQARVPGRDIVLVRHTPVGWVYINPTTGGVHSTATAEDAVLAALGVTKDDSWRIT